MMPAVHLWLYGTFQYRTYNFPIVKHIQVRINKTFSNVPTIYCLLMQVSVSKFNHYTWKFSVRKLAAVGWYVIFVTRNSGLRPDLGVPPTFH